MTSILISVADKITVESPYRATLTSIFPDGTRRQRKNVEGVLQRKYLNNIRAEYSQVREIKEIKTKESSIRKEHKGWESNEKRSSKDRLSSNYNDNYVTRDGWNEESSVNHNIPQKTKRQQEMLSDQNTQKSLTRNAEKEKQLPLGFKPSNSSQKLLYLSNFSILLVSFFVTFFSTVLSIRFNTNSIISQSLRTR